MMLPEPVIVRAEVMPFVADVVVENWMCGPVEEAPIGPMEERAEVR